jgi:lysophospholipase L1-like esterase
MRRTILLAVAFLFVMGSEATAQPPHFNPPKQYYLALGDSLAFGFQFSLFNQYYPDVPAALFRRGYVDRLGAMLRDIRPDVDTINLGCPEETTDTFLEGGCLYTAQGFQLHEDYEGSQLDAAIAFLQGHPGRVSPITFNLGGNDLNALASVCGSDFSCYQGRAPIVLGRIAANVDRILAALRDAVPDAEIVTFTNYNVAFLADVRFLQLTAAFNEIVTATAARHGVRVADVFGTFDAGSQPATICSLTFICSSGDSHPTDAGYEAIAQRLWQVSGYERIR